MSATPAEPSPHLDIDALADVVADEAGPADAEHLAECASCTSRLHELGAADARVLAALGALPAPVVPADLADRLTAALAGEQPPVRATDQPPVRPAAVTALPAGGGARRRSWLPAAAAAVLLVSGAGLGYSLLQGGTGDQSGAGDQSADTASSASRAEAGDTDLGIPLTASGTDWSAADAASTGLPQVLSGQAPPVPLQEQSDSNGTTDEVGPLAKDALSALRTPARLAACLRSVLPPDEPDLVPLAVDYAAYAGEPALAVVLPDPDPTQVSIFVVGAGCSAEDDGTLFFLRAPRP